MNITLKRIRIAPLLVGVIGVVASLLTAAVFLRVEHSEAEMQFHQLATMQLDSVHTHTDDAVELVHLLAAHMQERSTDLHSRVAFSDFARATLETKPYFQTLEWAPHVAGSERETYEQAARANGYANFRFMALSGEVSLVPETPRPEYFPVFYLEPNSGNESVLGLDLLSGKATRAALEQAVATHKIAITSRVQLLQEEDKQYGVLILAPVFGNRKAEAGGSAVTGIALATLRMRELIDSQTNMERDHRHLVALHVFDVSAPASEQLLYSSLNSSTDGSTRNAGPRQSIWLKIGGRTWEVVATPGTGYATVAAWSTPIAVLVLGLIITGIGVKYLRMVAQAQRKSVATAEELRHMNRALRARSMVNLALATASSEPELLERTVNIIAQESGYPLAWIGAPLQDENRSIAVLACAGIDLAYLKKEAPTWSDGPAGQGPTGTAIRERTTVMIEDLLSDPWYGRWAEQAREHRLRSVLSVPLMVGDELVAVLTVYAREDHIANMHAFKEEEARLIMELAKDLSFGIESLRRRQQAEEEHAKRKQLEEQLQQSQRIEAVGRLAGGIAHDFNNLLMVIMAHTELLMQNLPAPARERANNIMRSATRAAELTSQLLTFSRKQLVQPVRLTFNEVLDGMADMMPTMLRADIELQVERCEQPWPVKVDRNQIERVLMNLVVNARDAMPGGGRLTIRTSNRNMQEDAPRPWYMAPGRYAEICVTDTGIGMDDETLRHLFEPFFTTKEQGKGTGLGLSMVYGIVKKAEGYIQVDSAPGRGTTFCIDLPYCNGDENGVTPATDTDAGCQVKATVLLVEDDARLRNVVSDFLRLGGHEVLTATGMEEACKIAEQHGPRITLLLTDVVLKGGNGPQVVKQLEDRGMHFKTIYMSGYSGDTIEHHGIFDSSHTYLQKPFSRDKLLTMIQDVLHTRG